MRNAQVLGFGERSIAQQLREIQGCRVVFVFKRVKVNVPDEARAGVSQFLADHLE